MRQLSSHILNALERLAGDKSLKVREIGAIFKAQTWKSRMEEAANANNLQVGEFSATHLFMLTTFDS
eukprot:5091705-Amphidinium_carterae.1